MKIDSNLKSSENINEVSTKEKSSRSKIGRSKEIIRDFLMSSKRYQSEAIRVLLLAVRRDEENITLSFEDKTALNRFLTDGLYKGECSNVDEVRAYRQNRAAELIGFVGIYLESLMQSIALTKFLMAFTSDAALAQQALNNLPPRPADMKSTPGTTANFSNQQGLNGSGTQGTQSVATNGYQNGSKQ